MSSDKSTKAVAMDTESRPRSPPPEAAKHQQTMADRVWYRQSTARDSRATITGADPEIETRLPYKPTTTDIVFSKKIPAPEPRPPLAHPIPQTDPAQHQHWNELKSRWEKWVSPKHAERTLHGPGSPTSPSAASPNPPTPASHIEIASLNQVISSVKDVTAAWHPASDLKPTNMAGVDAVASAPAQVYTSQSTTPAQPSTPVSTLASLAGGGTGPTGTGTGSGSSSPLQKLREKFGFGGESRERGGSSSAGGSGGSTPSPSSLHRRVVSHNAPTMDIGSPLPSNARRIVPAETPDMSESANPTTTSAPVQKKSPPPLEPVAAASSPSKPVVRRFIDSMKGLWRRASFSAPTPVSDMRSPTAPSKDATKPTSK